MNDATDTSQVATLAQGLVTNQGEVVELRRISRVNRRLIRIGIAVTMVLALSLVFTGYTLNKEIADNHTQERVSAFVLHSCQASNRDRAIVLSLWVDALTHRAGPRSVTDRLIAEAREAYKPRVCH